MKIKIIPIFILIICCGTAWGQSVIYEFPGVYVDTAIVRHWKSEYNVIYASNANRTKQFLLADTALASSSAYKIDVPDNITINDFRILNDTVYFGGHIIDSVIGLMGVVACFDINDFFAGSGRFHIAEIPSSHLTLCSGSLSTIKVWDVLRLALYDTNGCIQVAYIATDDIGGAPPTRVGIGWARFDGANWQTQLIYNKDGKEAYTDIIATDNYVVACARTTDSSLLALRVFPKSDYIVPRISCENYYPYKHGDGWADHILDSDVMATAMDGNTFAVAYHYQDGTGTGLAIKTFTIGGGHANATSCWNGPIAPPSTPDWKVRDICYLSSRHRILVLDDVWLNPTTGYTSHIFQFQQPFTASGTYNGRYIMNGRLYSLDGFVPAGMRYASAGISPLNLLSLFCENPNVTVSCGQTEGLFGTKNTASGYQTYMETYTIAPAINTNTITFYPTTIIRGIMCIN